MSENPYQTPASDLTSTPESLHAPKVGWKFYFWLILVLEIIGLYSSINEPDVDRLYTVLEVIVYSVIIFGVFGFSHNKRIFHSKFWLTWIPIGIAYDIYITYLLIIDFEVPEKQQMLVLLALTITLPLWFLQYLALYKYGSKSPEIWDVSNK
ncbi:hypothetical protein QSV34_09015 [Porticoccus sp. W117]|uniref:hypothetical protein n=1 Tax=Porticoccus sp. W117 TaxID=3054777 RepID=UPI002595B121|nr:hypothetical protein [Porticoccus sp. W117]MDM3871495.1 hypothetical protein [Porticoccus sp. W117]